MGLIIATILPPGWLMCCRKISLSLAKSAVRFFSLGANCQAQGNLPATHQPTGGQDGRDDQSHPPGLGELFPDRAFESMLREDQRLGRNEDPTSSDAVSVTQRKGLEPVE